MFSCLSLSICADTYQPKSFFGISFSNTNTGVGNITMMTLEGAIVARLQNRPSSENTIVFKISWSWTFSFVIACKMIWADTKSNAENIHCWPFDIWSYLIQDQMIPRNLNKPHPHPTDVPTHGLYFVFVFVIKYILYKYTKAALLWVTGNWIIQKQYTPLTNAKCALSEISS